MRLPEQFDHLRTLCMRRRTVRSLSRPTLRTHQRRIAAEKKRLLDAGVDRFVLEAVCNYFMYPERSPAGTRAEAFLKAYLQDSSGA